MNVDGSGKEVIYSEEGVGRYAVQDFSTDGSQVLFAMTTTLNGKDGVNLIEIDINNKTHRILKSIEAKANSFRYAPKDSFIAYTSQDDIYILNTETNQTTAVTSFDGMDYDPAWSLEGDKLLFISDRQGSNDLFFVAIENGVPVGSPKALKRHLGEGPKLMGVDNQGAVYISSNTSRTEIYTAQLSENLDLLPGDIQQISTPGSGNSNGHARFSKDGKYISYQSNLTSLAGALRKDINSKYRGYDEELGWPYSIYVYNTETRETKFLDIELYLNHYPRSQAWMVPTWSYHAPELLVHGRVPEGYSGGFFLVNVETETVTPALTKPNCKVGMEWNEMEMGNSMFFSRKKDVFYYSAPGWKKAMQYNIKTGEQKTIATIEDGFWFEGFLNKEETKLHAANRYGYFEYDINTNEKKKYAERDQGKSLPLFPLETEGFSMYVLGGRTVFSDVLTDALYEYNLKFVRDSGEESVINLGAIFPECLIRLQDYQPLKKQLLLSVTRNPGREIYKLSNVFE